MNATNGTSIAECGIQPWSNQSDAQDLNTFLYGAYSIMLPALLISGVIGNILNLITLQNKRLRSVPFMYVRAVSWYDLIALSLTTLACLRISQILPTNIYLLVFYQAYFELFLLNSFLSAALFAAFALTVERYVLICRPHEQRRLPPEQRARRYIALALVIAVILHVPMSAEYQVAGPCRGSFQKRTNPLLDISQNHTTEYVAFKVYGAFREFCRVVTVIILAVLNVLIVKSIEQAQQRRLQMTLRKRSSDGKNSKGRSGSIFHAFEERRLSAMMIGMTVVYIVGNLPQVALMVLNEDDIPDKGFHYFRVIANLMEMANHCLNFYIFCISSRDYSKTFLETCMYPKSALVWCWHRQDRPRQGSNDSEKPTKDSAKPLLLVDSSQIHRGRITSV